GNKSSLALALIAGLIAACIGVVLAAPTCLSLLARAARRAPIVVRLALRDLARYRARSGAALGAISLSVLIAVIIGVVPAARFGNALDCVGPNLAADHVVVYPAAGNATPPDGTAGPVHGPSVLLNSPTGSYLTPVTGARLAAMAAHARGIAALI